MSRPLYERCGRERGLFVDEVEARFVIQGRDAAPSASQDSAAPAAFLLDAMAAPASALRVSGLASTPRK